MHPKLYRQLHQQKDRHHHLHHQILPHPRLERTHFATNSYESMIRDGPERLCKTYAALSNGLNLP